MPFKHVISTDNPGILTQNPARRCEITRCLLCLQPRRQEIERELHRDGWNFLVCITVFPDSGGHLIGGKNVLPAVWKIIHSTCQFLLSLRYGVLRTRVHSCPQAHALPQRQEDRGCLRRLRTLLCGGRDRGAGHLADAGFLVGVGNPRLFYCLDRHAAGAPAAGRPGGGDAGSSPAGGPSLRFRALMVRLLFRARKAPVAPR